MLHRFLLNVTDPSVKVDHRDGDGLNNVRSNLRTCTDRQNGANSRKWPACSSTFKGVWWHKRMKRWIAVISVEGRTIHLGYFELETDAARQYNAVAFLVHGEFARLNDV